MSVFDNMKAASGTGTARGTFPIIKNSANGKFKNLKLFGASTKAEGQIKSVVLNSIKASRKNILLYPYHDSSTKVTEGITFEADKQGVVTINGTSTGDAYLDLYNNSNEMLVNEPIIFSKGAVNTATLFYFERIDGKWNVGQNSTESQTEIEITPSKNATGQIFRITLSAGKTASNLKIYPMIRPASISNADYEPYEGNIANLPDAIEMNGIGELKDYIDYERGVFVQKFGVVVFDGSDDENWKSAVTSVSGKFRNTTSFLNNLAKPYDITVVGNLLCTHYEAVASNSSGTWGAKQGLCIDGSSVVMVYDDSFNTENISLWKTHLQANPMTLVYELAEPIETPLSPAALLELNKLRTFDSTTCVSNDAGAEMEIEYFKNNATGQAMSDIHAGVPRFVLDGTTLNIIV